MTTAQAHTVLETDGYKFSMAEVGWPLRTETFCYSHRKGGPQVMPVDARAFVGDLFPQALPDEYAYLERNGYGMGEGFRAAIAMKDRVVIRAVPRGAFFLAGEPVFTVTGPSALVSWLEPLVLQLNYRIQVATTALRNRAELERHVRTVTCAMQREIVLETLDSMNIGIAKSLVSPQPEEYHAKVLAAVRALTQHVDPSRIFEVGLRSASCMDQHEIALAACREAGVTRTSNVHLAKRMGLVPVGTMGHEHVQRYGSDEAAFRAMRDRRPHRSSYLLDTYETMLCGIPAAFRVMAEQPERRDSIRYDSGDKMTQFLYAATVAKNRGLRPIHIIESELDLPETLSFEILRKSAKVEPDELFYGYGGYIVAATAPGALTRDAVSAVWKLSQTGPQATMKFSNDPGKGSLPGKPVVFRRASASGPAGIVGQEGEKCPEGYRLLTDSEPPMRLLPEAGDTAVIHSPATAALRKAIHRRMEREAVRSFVEINTEFAEDP